MMGMVLPDSLMGICMAENRNAEEHISNAPLVRLFKVVIDDWSILRQSAAGLWMKAVSRKTAALFFGN